MKTRNLLNSLAKRFPKRLAKLYHDHVGLMTGNLPDDVNKILLCLDCDEEIYPMIENIKPDLIISHHPFIYGTKAKVLKNDPYRRSLCEKIDALGIPVYSMHTNFDAGKGGMNDALANKLGLVNIRPGNRDIMMRIGELPSEMNTKEFAEFAVKAFDVDYSLLINKGKEKVKTVAIIGGGGSRNWMTARDEGADIYISGDAPHYVRRDVNNRNYNYLDMPHEIEKIFMPTMKKILLDLDSSLEIVCIDHEKLPLVIK